MRILLAQTVLLATVGGALAQNDPPPVSVPHVEGIVEELSVSFPPPPEESGEEDLGPAQWAQSFARPSANVMQLHLKNIAFDAGEFFEIDVIDASGARVQKLTNETLKGATATWTNNGRGNSIALAVYGNRKGSLKFSVDAVSFDRQGAVLESIVGTDERQHLYAYQGNLAPTVNATQGPVAKLSYIKTTVNGPKRLVCTGFLIDDDTLITNEHCASTPELCATTKVMFGFAFDKLGQMPSLEQYDCASVAAVNVDLDLAVLKLNGSPGPKWGTVKLAAHDAVQGDRLFLLQHPAGEAKQISDLGCKVFEPKSPGRAPDSDFAHECDTLGGSSGSPVFNIAGEVVGLHHWGRDITGRYSVANRAVRIEPIKAFLEGLGDINFGGTTDAASPTNP
jgi:V8-like Glu-specific endopeptidase